MERFVGRDSGFIEEHEIASSCLLAKTVNSIPMQSQEDL